MKATRLRLQKTLRTLSEETQISMSRLSALENRRAYPDITEKEKLYEVLGQKIKFEDRAIVERNEKDALQLLENMETARKSIVQTGLSNGQIKCPVCQNNLNFTVSPLNGHVHANCTTPNCLNWME